MVHDGDDASLHIDITVSSKWKRSNTHNNNAVRT